MPWTVIAVFAGLGGVLAAATPAQAAGAAAAAPGAAPPSVVLTASAAPRPPSGATKVGPLAAASTVRLDVTLKGRGRGALTAFLAGLSDRGSPLFHQFLLPGQFGPRFGATLAQVTAVQDALKAAGLSPGPVSADRLSIPVTATAGAVDRALGASLARYRMPGGRIAYANAAAPRLAASVAPLVAGVVGLNDLYPQQTLASPLPGPAAKAAARPPATPGTAGQHPCTTAQDTASLYGALTASQLAAHYGLTPLYSQGDLGQGTRVALVEFEPNLTSDITAYKSCYGVTAPVSYLHVDGGAGTGAGSGEAALDIETAAGLAPDASVDVYQAPNTGAGNYDDYQAIVNADTDKTISTSWGLCEDYVSLSDDEAMESLFEQANAQGQTVFAASGDSGSTECLQSGGADAGAVNAQTPSSLPYVDGVGGTSLAGPSEVTWNQSATYAGAGGGGISSVWCMPDYQYQTAIPGLVNADSQTNAACPLAEGRHLRQVPDISADADPYSGYVIDYDGGWTAIGGTSAAAPLWAAIAALTDASAFCADYGSGAPGILPEGLYGMVAGDHSYIYPGSSQEVAEALADVTSGNDDYTPSGYTGGRYPAGPGYDEATGLGVPRVSGLDGSLKPSTFYPGLTALMCKAYSTRLTSTAVTSITPRLGRAGHAVTVTVHGSGFLPIAGADMAFIGSARVAASCTSTTVCHVTLPALSARTVDVKVSAEDYAASPAVKGDHFQYVAAPGISSLSPARGPARGRTRVTVRGTSFIGVTAVHFGARAATGVKVISSSAVTALAPAGSGTVHVTVTAAGGTSSAAGSRSGYKYS
jgi:hypothetical protein